MTSKNGIETTVKKRVLLVDDEARVRASLKAVLEPVYEVIQAADAQEGLDLFHKEAPHVVLLDVILPGTDGLSVLQALRTDHNPTPATMPPRPPHRKAGGRRQEAGSRRLSLETVRRRRTADRRGPRAQFSGTRTRSQTPARPGDPALCVP